MRSFNFTKVFLCVLSLLFLNSEFPLVAQEISSSAEPSIVSVFPLGGQRGKIFEVEIQGRNLGQVSSVWFDCQYLRGNVESVKGTDLAHEGLGASKKVQKQLEFQVTLMIEIGLGARVGAHLFRLITPLGLSNPLTLQVSSGAVIQEKEIPNESLDELQKITPPVIVNGRVGEDGDVDYYSLEVTQPRRLLFELGAGDGKFDPTLTLYEQKGSWFNPHRLIRLAYNDEPNSRFTKAAKLVYSFSRTGNYVVAVGGFTGFVGLDGSYQLSVAPDDSEAFRTDKNGFTQRSAHPDRVTEWSERKFSRSLNSSRIQELLSRTAGTEEGSLRKSHSDTEMLRDGEVLSGLTPNERAQRNSSLTLISEREPNDELRDAEEVPFPVIIKGTIQYPGDADYFKFKIKSQKEIAFEIRTTDIHPTQFNPQVLVMNASGQKLLTNIFRKEDFDLWIRTIEPKVIYTFAEEGEYYLRVSELTSTYGNGRFDYQVLVRPQIPHVGEIRVQEDGQKTGLGAFGNITQLNIPAGDAKKLTILVEQEEDFEGEIVVFLEDLPPGVQVLPVAELETPRGAPFEKIHAERFVPKSRTIKVLVLADGDAHASVKPHFSKLKILPVFNGVPGKVLIAKEIPMMVVAPEKIAELTRTRDE